MKTRRCRNRSSDQSMGVDYYYYYYYYYYYWFGHYEKDSVFTKSLRHSLQYIAI